MRNLRHLQSGVINDNFMESSLDEATAYVFQLLSCLNQKIAASSRKFNGDPLPSVSCPDVESRISRPPMDCQEVEICVKARKDGVLPAIFDEVRCGWGEKMGSFVHQ